jgi:transcription antitermination factor NusG
MSKKNSWYVVHSKPRKEHLVYKQLCAKSIEAYYPTIRVKPVNPRASKIRPFFPRYLFVHTNLDEIGVGTIQWMPGVKDLMPQGSEPISIPDSIISELKRLVAAIGKGGTLDAEYLKQGSLVQITDGTLVGNDVLFDMQISGSDRVMVLLSLADRHNIE